MSELRSGFAYLGGFSIFLPLVQNEGRHTALGCRVVGYGSRNLHFSPVKKGGIARAVLKLLMKIATLSSSRSSRCRSTPLDSRVVITMHTHGKFSSRFSADMMRRDYETSKDTSVIFRAYTKRGNGEIPLSELSRGGTDVSLSSSSSGLSFLCLL